MAVALENRVGFWPRAAAYMLDIAALSLLAMALQRPLSELFPGAVAAVIQRGAANPEAKEMLPMMEWAARLNVSATFIAPFYALIEAARGWSPGKLVLGLRIVTEAGQRAPLSSLFIRFAIKGAASLIALAAILGSQHGLNGLIWAVGMATNLGCLLVFSKERTAMHDRIAGTAVLRKGDVVVATPRPGPVVS